MNAVKGQKRGVTASIDWAECGTEANYRRHHRLGEKPCPACLRVSARISADRKRKRKAR